MKFLSKIIIISLVGVMVITLFGPIVLAKTLREIDQQAITKYQNAKQQYQNEVNFYKSARQDFLNALNKYRSFKNATNKKALESAARKFLEKVVNSLIKRLEVIKNWVSNRRALPEAERQAIVAEIDKDINWLNERLPQIPTATPKEIKTWAKTILQYWKTHRAKVKKIIGQIWAARISFVIDKAESFSTKVNEKIQELKAAGKDTTQLEAWLADFNEKLALAKEKYEVAKAKFQAIKGEMGPDYLTELSEADTLFRAGHQFIKEANQYIREAHALLVQIVNEMKKMGKRVETNTQTETNSAG